MTAHKVIVTEPIHQAGVELLGRNGVEVVQLPPGSDEETLQAEAPRAAALITRGGSGGEGRGARPTIKLLPSRERSKEEAS